MADCSLALVVHAEEIKMTLDPGAHFGSGSK